MDLFKAMVEELRGHPDVVVTHFRVRPPAHNLWLRKASSLLDGKLPDAISQFYGACDGLQLRWVHRQGDSFNPNWDSSISSEEFECEIPPEEGGQATGCVNILPISWVFGGRSWEGLIWRHTTRNTDKVEFGGRYYPRLDFLQSVQPFDQFDTYYNVAHIFAAQDGEGIPMVMGSGHHSDYAGTARLDADAYFEFLLRTKGLVAARPRYLGATNGVLERFGISDALAVPVLNLDGDDWN